MSYLKVDDVLEAYNGLIGNWDIASIISEIKNSWDREAMTDLFRISASLITTIESQKKEKEMSSHRHALYAGELREQIESQKEEIEEFEQRVWKEQLQLGEQVNFRLAQDKIESLKAITELAVKGLEEIADSDYSGPITGEDAQEMRNEARSTLSEIERIRNAQT